MKNYVACAIVAVNEGYIKNPIKFSPRKRSSVGSCKDKIKKVVSGITFSSGGWSSDEDTSTQTKLTLPMFYENEARRVFKNWRKHRFH